MDVIYVLTVGKRAEDGEYKEAELRLNDLFSPVKKKERDLNRSYMTIKIPKRIPKNKNSTVESTVESTFTYGRGDRI